MGYGIPVIYSSVNRIYFWPCLAFESSTDPLDTSAQAALAPHPTMEQEESSDTTFMVMRHVILFALCC
jgi:hypothetical protein